VIIRATSTTIGQSSPDSLTLRKPYRWRQIPDWEPGDPRYRDDDTPRRPTGLTKERAKRLTDFALLRAQGLSILEAGEEMGVKAKTAYEYNRDWQALQRQQQAGGAS
jgi:hypothetical protein